MTGGRRFRRQAGRIRWRRPDVEPSADVRTATAAVLRAHDDDAVTLAEFADVMRRWAAAIGDRPEPERLEAIYQVSEHCASSLVGRRLLACGWFEPDEAAS